MPCNSGQCREQKTSYLCAICNLVQTPATPDRSLVAGAGQRFSSSLVGSLFCLEFATTGPRRSRSHDDDRRLHQLTTPRRPERRRARGAGRASQPKSGRSGGSPSQVESSQGRRPCRSASANDASDTSFRAFDCDTEVVALALNRVHLAVEFADPHDAVPEPDVAVVEDEVAVWGPVADVSDYRVVSLRRTVERQLAGKRGDLFYVVEVAEGERQRQPSGEIARRGVVVQPSSEHRIAEGDPNRRDRRGVGVLVAGGRSRTWRRSRSARSGSAGGLVAVLVSPTASREGDGRQESEQVAEATRPMRPPKAKRVRCGHGSPRSGVQRAV